MIIDTDAHWPSRRDGPSRVQSKSGLSVPWTANCWIPHYLHRIKDQFSMAETRVQELSQLGIDRQVLNPWGVKLTYAIDTDLCADIMSVYNDSMLGLCKNFPEFDVNLWVGLQNIDASVREIQSRLDQDFFAVYVSDIVTHGFRSNMEPLWKLLSQHKIPLYLHQTDECDAKILLPEQQWQQIYDNLEVELSNKPWAVVVASLILGGVFDRHPDLRVIIAERNIDWIRPMCQVLEDLGHDNPLPVLKNNFWFTTEPETKDFMSHADFIGWDRLLFATDWPHDFDQGGANRYHDVETVRSLPVDDFKQKQLFSDNYMTLKR